MSQEISKVYEFAQVEEKVTNRWLDKKAFQANPDEREKSYVIMMPLPNVTGALHMGHAMDNVMQDLLIRWHRMMDENTLWQPGTDHAGIATQAVVEKRLYELEGKTRHDVGRDGLVEKIWAWTDKCQKRIVSQQQRMGCSCDWDRQRFTMDDVCKAAVRECFYKLFKDKLIFRGYRLVNWDCYLQTAVSDDEIVTEDVQGHFWHLRYPIVDPKDGEPEYVVVATTRPETMLGDTAVACHPDPEGELNRLIEATRERLAKASQKEQQDIQTELDNLEERKKTVLPLLITLRDMARDGRQVTLPLQNRPIPLILDEWAKPGLGSGCVKITPGHDPNDYDVWTRHKDEIDIVNILVADGTLNENAGSYKGQDMPSARKNVLKDLEAQGLIEQIEDRVIPIGHSDRSKTPIEPYLSKQWFVRMGDVDGGLTMAKGSDKEFKSPGLAQAAIDAVEGEWTSPTGKKLTFYPDSDRYANSYLAWLKEKRDWCISRQLWWGHRIPIWIAQLTKEQITELASALPKTDDHYLWIESKDDHLIKVDEVSSLDGDGTYEVQLCLREDGTEEKYKEIIDKFNLEQDPDVLDTWFSSALWPFSTLGWPNPAAGRENDGQSTLKDQGKGSALDYYYPGSCLVTARDIITLWVARMLIMGLYNLGDVPFTDCFIHANIQDGKGERMSKSKGNGIDPVDIIERYGTDALRYVLADMQSGTQDIRLPVQAVSPFFEEEKLIDLAKAKHGRSIFTYICPHSGKEFDVLGTMDDLPSAKLISDRFDVGRSFCTKLWNAARFAFLSLSEHTYEAVKAEELEDEDKWILARLNATIGEVTNQLVKYNPSAAIGTARDFFWSDLCDWYIELIKSRLKDETKAPKARTVLSLVLDQVIRLFHPFVPFITEELWEKLNAQVPKRGLFEEVQGSEMLINAAWPKEREEWQNDEMDARFELLRSVIRSIRDIKARYQVAPKTELDVAIKATGKTADTLQALSHHISSQAYLKSVSIEEAPVRSKTAATSVIGDLEIFVDGVLDNEKERKRLEKQKAKLEKLLQSSERKLNNPKFVDKAPPHVVEQERGRIAETKSQLAAIEEGLKALD
jgi:valyl-tRNA synthetase